MPKFSKRPVVIDAIQWTGDNLHAVICFTDGEKDTRTMHAKMKWDDYAHLVARDGLKIYTLEGTMKADVGDWVIRGIRGEYYPCKPDIFAATYAPVGGLSEGLPDPMSDERARGLVDALERVSARPQGIIWGECSEVRDAMRDMEAIANAALASLKGGGE